jgi:WD40 repeat protein
VTFQYFGHTRLAFSPDGGTLVVGERLWDIEKHQIIGGSLGNFLSFAFSPDKTTLAASDFGNSIRLWNMSPHTVVGKPIDGQAGQVYAMDFSPDGKILASGGQDTAIRLWDVANYQLQGAPLTGHRDTIGHLTLVRTARSSSLGAETILSDCGMRRAIIS